VTKRKAASPFVKSAETSTPVASSKAELEKMLRRYGAAGFSVAHDYAEQRVILTLVLPDTPAEGAPRVPVKLPVSVRAVYDKLYGRPTRYMYSETRGQPGRTVYNPSGYDARKMEQAERVAWRNLVLWVDAALSAATVGLQTITEAFFAHTIAGERGERMIEVVEQAQAQLGSGVQRLLESPSEDA
jgi:hypothetical protein